MSQPSRKKPVKSKTQKKTLTILHPDVFMIPLKAGEYTPVNQANIIYFEAQKNYSDIFYYEKNEILKATLCFNLGLIATELLAYDFIRIHAAYLINNNQIKIINPTSHYVIMQNGEKLNASEAHYDVLLRLFHRFKK